MGYTGGKLNEQRAMGMMMIERSYDNDDNTIKVTLTQGGAGGSIGALGALANIGMMGGGKKSRIHGHTATDMSDDRAAKLMVSPRNGGGFINFESRDVEIDEVKAFAKDFLEDFDGF